MAFTLKTQFEIISLATQCANAYALCPYISLNDRNITECECLMLLSTLPIKQNFPWKFIKIQIYNRLGLYQSVANFVNIMDIEVLSALNNFIMCEELIAEINFEKFLRLLHLAEHVPTCRYMLENYINVCRFNNKNPLLEILPCECIAACKPFLSEKNINLH